MTFSIDNHGELQQPTLRKIYLRKTPRRTRVKLGISIANNLWRIWGISVNDDFTDFVKGVLRFVFIDNQDKHLHDIEIDFCNTL